MDILTLLSNIVVNYHRTVGIRPIVERIAVQPVIASDVPQMRGTATYRRKMESTNGNDFEEPERINGLTEVRTGNPEPESNIYKYDLSNIVI